MSFCVAAREMPPVPFVEKYQKYHIPSALTEGFGRQDGEEPSSNRGSSSSRARIPTEEGGTTQFAKPEPTTKAAKTSAGKRLQVSGWNKTRPTYEVLTVIIEQVNTSATAVVRVPCRGF